MWGKSKNAADDKGSKTKMPALDDYYKFLKSDNALRTSPEKRSRLNSTTATRGKNVETPDSKRRFFPQMNAGYLYSFVRVGFSARVWCRAEHRRINIIVLRLV